MSLLKLRPMNSLNLSVMLTAALAIGACDDNSASDDGGDDAADAADLPEGCDLAVAPSDDDQTAVQEALIEVEDGQVVCLAAGSYAFTRQLNVDANDITIRGDSAETTILDFSDQKSGGNGMLITGDNTTIEDLQVKNTPGDGIRADQVDGISFVRMSVVWDASESLENGAYGLYPVQSSNVLIAESSVVGARDAGVYVGQSNGIVVEDSEAFGNVAGIEIENSVDAQVRRNHAHDNTAGILVFNLPGLDIKDGRRTNVYDNLIENNNVDNFGEAGTVVALVPPGVGVLVLAADETEVGNNTITGNRSIGIGLIAYISGLFGDPMDDAFDIYSQSNWVHDNTFENNGTDPDDLLLTITLSPESYDIVFGGCADPNLDDAALDNCISDNGDASFLRGDACAQNMGVSSDAALATCTKTPQPRSE